MKLASPHRLSILALTTCYIFHPCLALSQTHHAPSRHSRDVSPSDATLPWGSSYNGITVLRIFTGTNGVSNRLNALIRQYRLDTWTDTSTSSTHVDVEVPEGVYENFVKDVKDILANGGGSGDGSITIMHGDLGESVRKEREGMAQAKQLALEKMNAKEMMGLELEGSATQDWFNSYHSYDDHITWLEDLVASFPNNTKIVSTGTTVEGRDIKGINIFGSSGSGAKPAVIWHGNVHAREWITSMTVEYLAYSLLNNYENSTQVRNYVDNLDFNIFPIVNPDGFIYSQTTLRLWRKNRQPSFIASQCVGRDINRNWNVSWASPLDGASDDPCDGNYRGETPGDSPEIKGLAAFLDRKGSEGPGAIMYVDWHSYSQLFLYPYGYNCSKIVPNNDEYDALVSGFAEAVYSVHKTNYTTGPSCSTIYPTSGSSADYAYDVSKVKYAFAAELRDTGDNGFLLPPDQIRMSGEETWEGVKYLLDQMVPKPVDDPPSPNTGGGDKPSSGSKLVVGINSVWVTVLGLVLAMGVHGL